MVPQWRSGYNKAGDGGAGGQGHCLHCTHECSRAHRGLGGPPTPALCWALGQHPLAHTGAGHTAILPAPSAISSQECHLPALPKLSQPHMVQPQCRVWQERRGLRSGASADGQALGPRPVEGKPQAGTELSRPPWVSLQVCPLPMGGG